MNERAANEPLYEVGKYSLDFKEGLAKDCQITSFSPFSYKSPASYSVAIEDLGTITVSAQNMEKLFDIKPIEEIKVKLPIKTKSQEIKDILAIGQAMSKATQEKAEKEVKKEDAPLSDLKKNELVKIAVEKGVKGAQALTKESLTEAIIKASED